MWCLDGLALHSYSMVSASACLPSMLSVVHGGWSEVTSLSGEIAGSNLGVGSSSILPFCRYVVCFGEVTNLGSSGSRECGIKSKHR